MIPSNHTLRRQSPAAVFSRTLPPLLPEARCWARCPSSVSRWAPHRVIRFGLRWSGLVAVVPAPPKEAKEKTLKVGVGLQRRHQPNYEEVIARLKDGAIGDILATRVYWNGGPVGPKARRADLEKRMKRAPTEMEYQVRNWYMFN